jgi:hypothetical protein
MYKKKKLVQVVPGAVLRPDKLGQLYVLFPKLLVCLGVSLEQN